MLLMLFLLCYKFQRHYVKLLHLFSYKTKKRFQKSLNLLLMHVDLFFLRCMCLFYSLEGVMVASRFNRSLKTPLGAFGQNAYSLTRCTLSGTDVQSGGQTSALAPFVQPKSQ
jgi:hypothetical protein